MSAKILNATIFRCFSPPTQSTPRGFEPLRAETNGFLAHLLSRSDTVSSACTLASLLLNIFSLRPSPTFHPPCSCHLHLLLDAFLASFPFGKILRDRLRARKADNLWGMGRGKMGAVSQLLWLHSLPCLSFLMEHILAPPA